MDGYVLNLMNKIPEDEAGYLNARADDETVSSARSMDLYVTHSNRLIAIGYSGGTVIWFSNTELGDQFLSRRVFDCMKYGSFYRYASVERVLETSGMVPGDLLSMCYTRLDRIETIHPVFSGCIVSADNQADEAALTGVEFARIMAGLPQRLRSSISRFGNDDDIIAHLEKDYQLLETIYTSDSVPAAEKRRTAEPLVRKWQGVECLKMSDRAAIRTLYRDVIYHKCLGE